MTKTSIRFITLNLTALAAFGIYELRRKVVILPPVYVYVKVPAGGMKMSEYESGCLSALTRVGAINAGNRQKLEDLARQGNQ